MTVHKKGIEERFWSKVNEDGPIPVGTPAEGNCWDWTASVRGTRKNYGQFRIKDGVTKEAHRVAWEIANGREVPAGMVIGHLCKRSLCVRPEHLKVMTRVEAGHNGPALSARNKSGIRGVTWSEEAKKWKVAVYVNGKQAHGGYFAQDKKHLAAARAKELRDQLVAEAGA